MISERLDLLDYPLSYTFDGNPNALSISGRSVSICPLSDSWRHKSRLLCCPLRSRSRLSKVAFSILPSDASVRHAPSGKCSPISCIMSISAVVTIPKSHMRATGVLMLARIPTPDTSPQTVTKACPCTVRALIRTLRGIFTHLDKILC